jgi:uncharacterized protein
VLIREDITVDQFIDVVLGNRKYLTCIYVSVDLSPQRRSDIHKSEYVSLFMVSFNQLSIYFQCYNKIDQITIEEVDRLARQENTVVVSCEDDLNLDYLVEQIWKHLNLLRVYTKKRGELPDFDEGLIIRNGATVEHCCHAIHRSLVEDFKYALVWGSSAKHNPQRVGLHHTVNNEDVIQVVKK